MDSIEKAVDLGQRLPVAEEQLVEESHNLLADRGKRSSLHMAKRALQSTIIALEVGPTNEAMRYVAFGAVLTQTRNPLVGAAVLGGSTLLVEGAAALATADLIASEEANKTINWINGKLNKFVPAGAKMPPVAEAGVAMLGGSVVVLAEKQREDPGRTVEQNRRHGMFTASWLAGVLAVEGALVANGVEDYHDPKSIGAALVAVGGLVAAAKWAKNRIRKNDGEKPGATG